MKRYIVTIGLAVLLVGACSKKEETPVDQKQKTEATITGVVDEGEKIQNTKASEALDNMPDGSPIESSFPSTGVGKSSLSSYILSHIPVFRRSVTKSPLDSLAGTWEYDEAADEWTHTSNTPSDGIVLIWTYSDDSTGTHTARFELSNLDWYNDSLISKLNAKLYVDNAKEAEFSYKLSFDNDMPTELELSGSVSDIYEFSVKVDAEEGHSIGDNNFYGEIHISFEDDESDVSYALDITVNEDGSSSFKFAIDGEDDNDWEVSWTVSAKDAQGRQTVSGYIKWNDTETARIEGTIVNGDFSEVYIVYSDGTRVAVTEYLAGVDTGGVGK